LNLFADPGDQDDLIAAVRPLATTFGAPDPNPDSTDEILARDCTNYRKLLTTATRYAVDLHLRPNLLAEQQALICIACRTSDPREDLKDHLKNLSSSYRADWFWIKWKFWRSFHLPGPRPNFSNAGHWIWNIVLGIDYPSYPWPSAASAAGCLGIPAPIC